MISSTASIKGSSGSENDVVEEENPADGDAGEAARRAPGAESLTETAGLESGTETAGAAVIAGGPSMTSSASTFSSSSPVFPAEFEPNLFVDETGEFFYQNLSFLTSTGDAATTSSAAAVAMVGPPRDHSSPRRQRDSSLATSSPANFMAATSSSPPLDFATEYAASTAAAINDLAAAAAAEEADERFGNADASATIRSSMEEGAGADGGAPENDDRDTPSAGRTMDGEGTAMMPMLPPSLPDYFLRGDGHIEDFALYRSMQQHLMAQGQQQRPEELSEPSPKHKQQQQQQQQQQSCDVEETRPTEISSSLRETAYSSQEITSFIDSPEQRSNDGDSPREQQQQSQQQQQQSQRQHHPPPSHQLLAHHRSYPPDFASSYPSSSAFNGGVGDPTSLASLTFYPTSSMCSTLHSPPLLDLPLHDEPQLLSDIDEMTENGSDLESPASRGSGTSGTSNGSSSGGLFQPVAAGHGSYAGFHG